MRICLNDFYDLSSKHTLCCFIILNGLKKTKRKKVENWMVVKKLFLTKRNENKYFLFFFASSLHTKIHVHVKRTFKKKSKCFYFLFIFEQKTSLLFYTFFFVNDLIYVFFLFFTRRFDADSKQQTDDEYLT